jgi:hypothetical protein
LAGIDHQIPAFLCVWQADTARQLNWRKHPYNEAAHVPVDFALAGRSSPLVAAIPRGNWCSLGDLLFLGSADDGKLGAMVAGAGVPIVSAFMAKRPARLPGFRQWPVCTSGHFVADQFAPLLLSGATGAGSPYRSIEFALVTLAFLMANFVVQQLLQLLVKPVLAVSPAVVLRPATALPSLELGITLCLLTLLFWLQASGRFRRYGRQLRRAVQQQARHQEIRFSTRWRR